MFQPGQLVVYGIHGVCKLLESEVRKIDRKNVEYYVLSPMEHPDARYYIPAHNQIALSKITPLLTKQELDSLLQTCASCEDYWIEDENQRKQKYKELISGADRASVLRMIRSLRDHKQVQLAAGRKFHQSDENFLRDAQRLLGEEFSYVLGIPAEQVGEYIENAFK